MGTIHLDGDRSCPTPPNSNATQGLFQLDNSVTPSVLAGTSPCMASAMVNFLVVKAPSFYNPIIYWPTLNSLKTITSTYHLKMNLSGCKGDPGRTDPSAGMLRAGAEAQG